MKKLRIRSSHTKLPTLSHRVTTMIKDWRTVKVAHPIAEGKPMGDPFAAHPLYMGAFVVLEGFAFGRLGFDDLLTIARSPSIAAKMEAAEEFARRQALGDEE